MEMQIWSIRRGIGCVGGEAKEGEIEEMGMRCDKTENRGHNEVEGLGEGIS